MNPDSLLAWQHINYYAHQAQFPNASCPHFYSFLFHTGIYIRKSFGNVFNEEFLFLILALLAAACPESAPFMADECLMAIPEIEGIDYTTKEYLKFVNHIQSVADRLNKAATESKRPDAISWSPHKVELAIWTHYVVSELKPELLSSKLYLKRIKCFFKINYLCFVFYRSYG